MNLQLVWFKRDLRLDDHRPLSMACRHGSVLPVYIVEPGYWKQTDASSRQQNFIAEALMDLHHGLNRLGQGLIVERGEAVEVFRKLLRRWRFTDIHAHEETGNDWTFKRDQAVRAWCRSAGVSLHEYPQFGVKRGLTDRDGWSGQWERFMAESPVEPPSVLPPVVETCLPDDVFSGAEPYGRLSCPGRQRGGLIQGRRVFGDFVTRRALNYRGGISSPLSAESAGSRLSPHIAYGTLSLRGIVQSTRQRLEEARASGDQQIARSLRHFDQRLHWHCHFIQKLEQEPRLEFENMHRGLDGMREHDFEQARFTAWAEGKTGYPLVDACMRFLTQTGWLNFRMRALLMSFSSYHLWLHWRQPALHLARLFTDYEPGIHYCQCQMQSGTTGINTLRIYNPVKQAFDQDSEAVFVRRWIPELAGVPAEKCFEPWKLGTSERKRFGAADYPAPIVDYQNAAKYARARIAEYRRRPGFVDQSRAIQRKLGSRKSQTSRRKPSGSQQLQLF